MDSSILGSADIQPRTRMIFGPGTLDQLGAKAAELMAQRSSDPSSNSNLPSQSGQGGFRVLVVSDPGVVKAGHVAKGIASLEAAGAVVTLFDGARENPTTEHVRQGTEVAHEVAPDLLVGLGGGSSMDCAKGINFLYTNGGQMSDYWGVDKAEKPMLPLICVPTTSGTGSEMQSFALISDATTHVKMACGDKKTAARVAILDPLLTLTQPPMVTALTAIDALSHAVETFVSKKRNAISQMYSREAFRLLSGSILRVLQDPTDLEARSQMHLGASLAGVAIENSMLGAAHALANPLTATFGTAHGQAVGLMLPHVVRLNASICEEDYADLMRSFNGQTTADQMVDRSQNNLETSIGQSLVSEADSSQQLEAEQESCSQGNYCKQPTVACVGETSTASGQLANWLTAVVHQANLATRLTELNAEMSEEALEQLGTAAAKQWTGTFNPLPVDAQILTETYRSAL